MTLQRDCDAWMRCTILLGQASQSQEQTIWIHSAKQLFPLFPHGKQEICHSFTVLPVPLTLLYISTSTASNMESLSHKGGGRWISSLPRVLPLNYWGLQQGRLEMGSATRPFLATMDAFGGFFFPPVLIQQWSQSIEQLSLLPIFWKIWSTFDYVSILM